MIRRPDPDPPPCWWTLNTDMEPRRTGGDEAPRDYLSAIADPKQIESWDSASRREEGRLSRARLARLLALKAEVAAGQVPPDQLNTRIAAAMGWSRHPMPPT